jgi:hypothetical protein
MQYANPIPPPYAKISEWRPNPPVHRSEKAHQEILKRIAKRVPGQVDEPEEGRLGFKDIEWEIGPEPKFRYGLLKGESDEG